MKIKISKNMYWNPLTFIKHMFILSCILFVIWVAISYGEVVYRNLDPNPEYFSWNIFQLLLRM